MGGVVQKIKILMKACRFILVGLGSLSSVLLLAGCSSTDYGGTSPYHPGPVAGKTVGNAVGVTAGNVAGFGVGAAEGVVHGVAAPFHRDYHMVRYWRTETTADGRTIQVPYDVLVDQYGRPVKMPAPTGNPKPPPAPATPPAAAAVPAAAAPAAVAPAPVGAPATAVTTNNLPQ